MKIKYFIIIVIVIIISSLKLYSQSSYCFAVDQSRKIWSSPDTVSTGIENPSQNDNSFTIQVYPNPFENKFNLIINSKIPQNYEIRIINIFGIEIYRRTEYILSEKQSININFQTLINTGIYFLIVSLSNPNNDLSATKRFKLIKY